MKQKFTIEKHKYLENKKSKNETMFNFKISCLMKKQLINGLMTLAIVFGLSVSAMAQPGGDGLTPGQAQLFAVGSTGQFSVTPSSTDNYLVWAIYDVSSTLDEGTMGTPISKGNGPANGLDFVTALGSSTTFNPDGDADAATSTTVYVKFYNAPAAGNVYVIQVSEYEGEDAAINDTECISIRRVYVSLFDFEVDVYFCTSTGDTTGIYAGTASDGDMAFKNNWDNSIIQNSLSAAWLNANNPALDTLNNDVSAYGKGDTIYYAVEVEFTGLPSDYDLNQIDWRYRYSFPTNGFSLNRINALALYDGTTDTPTFIGESDTPSSWGDDASGNPIYNGVLTFPSSTDYSGQNSVSVPLITTPSDSKHRAKYVFEVALHKDFPETADNRISVSIDEVQLRMGGTDYNDGVKDNDGIATNDIDLLDGATGIQTIYSNPSTSVITITR